jgi:hypothetical protein
MNAACPALCAEVLYALGPAVLAAVVTTMVLLANWVLSFPLGSQPKFLAPQHKEKR